MRYPVVLFDVGETLVGPRESFGGVYARVLRDVGVDTPVDVLERALRDTWLAIDAEIPAGVDRYRHYPGGEAEYWLRFARRTLQLAGDLDGGMPEGTAERIIPLLRDAFLDRDAWRIYDDVLPALDGLRDQGTRLGVVSNWDSRLPQVLAMLDLAPYFETVVVSHLEGIEKPDPALFRIALDRMQVEPGSVLYIGDRPELDLAGARAAGIDGLIVDRRGAIEPGDEIIPDLSPVPGIALAGISG